MASRKVSKSAKKSRIEQNERNTPIQENQIKNQLVSGQRKTLENCKLSKVLTKISNIVEKMFLNMYIIHRK